LFKLERIESFIRYFKEITAAVLKDMEVKLRDIKCSIDLKGAEIDIPEINFKF
jgi:hypothetical protein